MIKRLLASAVVLIVMTFTACTLSISPVEGKATPSPLSQKPTGGTLTPIPTLGAETAWLEPQSRQSLIFERPSPSGGQDLYRLPPDGSSPIKLTNIQEELFYVSASPDGKFLAIQTRPPAGVNHDVLSLLSLSDLRLSPVVKETWITTIAWSPAGDALVFSEWTENGVSIVYYDLTSKQIRTIIILHEAGPWSIVSWALVLCQACFDKCDSDYPVSIQRRQAW